MKESISKVKRQPAEWGENNSKWNNCQRINLQNIQAACAAQYWKNKGRTVYDINHSKILYDPPLRIMEIKIKINKWDLIKLKSSCTAKESINKVKKTNLRMWENKSKWNKWQRIYFQNIKATLTTQYQKTKNSIKKWAKDLRRCRHA